MFSVFEVMVFTHISLCYFFLNFLVFSNIFISVNFCMHKDLQVE